MSAWLRQTRVRLALAYSATFFIVAVVAGAALWLSVATLQRASVDESLRLESSALQALMASGDGNRLSGSGARIDLAGGTGMAAYLFDANGLLLDQAGPARSSSALAHAVRQAAERGPVLETVTVEGLALRARAVKVALADRGSRLLVVTRPRAEGDQLLQTTAALLVLGGAVLVTVATVLGYGLAQAALRPVREIVAAARTLGEQDLHRRITLDLPADELGDLADTFNQMLTRLETAFDSLRRFTADAAHELRAPLALIRTEVEVALSRPRSPDEYRATLGIVLSEVERLARMADQLLMLARAEAGALPLQLGDVVLEGLVTGTVDLWRPVANGRGVEISSQMSSGVTVRGDVDLLRRMLDNLVDNAIRHSPRGGEVRVVCAVVGDSADLTVSDAGPGVPEAARSSIFERFSRADEARGRETGGAGLGLALCKAIADLHRGSISLDDGPANGTRFRVRLPIASLADPRGETLP